MPAISSSTPFFPQPNFSNEARSQRLCRCFGSFRGCPTGFCAPHGTLVCGRSGGPRENSGAPHGGLPCGDFHTTLALFTFSACAFAPSAPNTPYTSPPNQNPSKSTPSSPRETESSTHPGRPPPARFLPPPTPPSTPPRTQSDAPPSLETSASLFSLPSSHSQPLFAPCSSHLQTPPPTSSPIPP